MKRPTFVSLFSGCGGFDLGFQAEHFRCVGAYDLDPLAIASHNANLKSRAQVADLSAPSFRIPETGSIDVVVAGPPCQGFSTAGKRDPDDPRNDLLITAGKIALRMKPRAFVAENVAGVASGPHARYWKRLQEVFRESGYQTASVKCRAENLGVPQIRTRLIMLAWNTGTHCDPALPESSGGVLSDALTRVAITGPHSSTFLSKPPLLSKIAVRIKPGQKLSNVRSGPHAVHTWNIPEVFGPTSTSEREVLEALLVLRRRERTRCIGDADPVAPARVRWYLRRAVSADVHSLLQKGYVRGLAGRIDLTHTFNGKYRRLDANRPSHTVDTKFGDPRYFLHPAEHRGFSVAEAASIQGFPAEFRIAGNARDQFRQIGNAVPPPMAARIAKFIREALLSTT